MTWGLCDPWHCRDNQMGIDQNRDDDTQQFFLGTKNSKLNFGVNGRVPGFLTQNISEFIVIYSTTFFQTKQCCSVTNPWIGLSKSSAPIDMPLLSRWSSRP